MIEMAKYAPLVTLIFLGACAGLVFMALTFLYGLVSLKRWVLRISTALAVCGILLYATLLFGFSLSSTEKILTIGGQKYFCEIDCHIAYSVTSVTTAAHFN